jgi:hypothetical protein
LDFDDKREMKSSGSVEMMKSWMWFLIWGIEEQRTECCGRI